MYHENKKVNKVNIFVKDCITTAFFDIIKDKEFEKITISEIIKKAGVSRMGFYRNFNSKENVIEDYVLNCFKSTVDKIKEKRKLSFETQNIILTTLLNFQKYANQIKLLLDRKLEHLLYNCYIKAFYSLYDRKIVSRFRDYSIHMFIAEIFYLEMTWIKNGMVEEPEKLAKIYFKILKLHLNSLNL